VPRLYRREAGFCNGFAVLQRSRYDRFIVNDDDVAVTLNEAVHDALHENFFSFFADRVETFRRKKKGERHFFPDYRGFFHGAA